MARTRRRPRVVSGADFEIVAEDVVERTARRRQEFLTLVTGDEDLDVASLAGQIRDRHPELELEVQHGGQPHYPLLLFAE